MDTVLFQSFVDGSLEFHERGSGYFLDVRIVINEHIDSESRVACSIGVFFDIHTKHFHGGRNG